MKNPTLLKLVVGLAGILLAAAAHAGDPLTNVWFTSYAGKYARITTNDATRTVGSYVTTWNNGVAAEAQTLPAYCGVQEIYFSTN